MSRRYRHRLLRRTLSISEQEFRKQLAELKHRKVIECHYCHQMVTLREATVDHKQPRAKGGGNGLDNIVLSCFSCNQRKGTTPYEEFDPQYVPPAQVLPPPRVKKRATKLVPSFVNGEHFLLTVDINTGELLGRLGPFHSKTNHAITYTSQMGKGAISNG